MEKVNMKMWVKFMQEQACNESFLFSAKKYFIHKYDSNNSRVLFVCLCLFFHILLKGNKKKKEGGHALQGQTVGRQPGGVGHSHSGSQPQEEGQPLQQRLLFFNCQGQERFTLKRPQIALPAVARGNLHAWFINGLQLHVGCPQLPKVFGVWTGVGEKVICKIKTSPHTCKFYNTKLPSGSTKGTQVKMQASIKR